jgi:hypothetical protein
VLSRDNSVGIATRLGVGRGSIPDKGKEYLSYLQGPDGLWCPTSFMPSTSGCFPEGKPAGA